MVFVQATKIPYVDPVTFVVVVAITFSIVSPFSASVIGHHSEREGDDYVRIALFPVVSGSGAVIG